MENPTSTLPPQWGRDSRCVAVGRALWIGLVLALVGCQPSAGPDDLAAHPKSASSGTALAAPAAMAPAPAGTAPYMSLLALTHLADVRDAGGLFVDFGTAARAKYTMGDWHSGWAEDAVIDGSSVTCFGKSGRVELPVLGSPPTAVRIRATSLGGTKLTLYLNGTAIRTVDVAARGGFEELVVSIPQERARAFSKPSVLLLRGDRVGSDRGHKGSFAVDWLRLEGAAGDGRGLVRVAPTPTAITASSVTRNAVMVPAGGELAWHAEVPSRGTLILGAVAEGATKAQLVVSAQVDGKPVRELVRSEVGSRWVDLSLPVGPLSGKVARLSFTASGGPVAVSDVRIVRAQDRAKPLSKQARNVVVLLIDTLRASKLQLYYPKSRVKTPALDAFAKEGAIFMRPQSPENWTKPAVASLLTSLHPMTHNTKEQGSKLPNKALTLGEVYQRAGFKTASFLANGYVSRAFGFDQGWDHYTNYIRERRNTNASNVFGEAAGWIEKHKAERFFVYIQTIDPHVPYDPPDAFLKMYDAKPYNGQVKNRRTHLMLDDAKKNPKKYNFTARDKERIEALHDGEISYHDEQFGIFLKKLDALGLADNTMVVVTSDHGEEFQEHGSWGHGHSVYQELLNVPLIMRFPGAIAAGTRIEPVVTTMDVAPTVLEASGVEVPGEFEGRSLIGFLLGDWPPAPHVAFSDFMDNRRVIVGADWKYIVRASLSHVAFDLANDPWEKRELKSAQGPIATRYLQILLGQYLGANDRGRWLLGGSAARKLDAEQQQMTPELCRQLVALGYISAECEALLQ